MIDKKRAKEDSYVHKNLRREGRILQLVRHPCIIQLYDILETENSYYLVMELCSGGDMMEYLKIRKSLPEKETRKYVRQIVSAVDHLHRAGILHRLKTLSYFVLIGHFWLSEITDIEKILHNSAENFHVNCKVAISKLDKNAPEPLNGVKVAFTIA